MAENFIKYRKGYKYQLAEDYTAMTCIEAPGLEDIVTEFITLTTEGRLTIKSGYACDGPSGPTIDTPSFMRGAFEHDAFYQLMRMGLLSLTYRDRVDNRLRDVCLQDGMWEFRANYVYRSLDKFGGSSADPKNKKKIYTAPKGTPK